MALILDRWVCGTMEFLLRTLDCLYADALDFSDTREAWESREAAEKRRASETQQHTSTLEKASQQITTSARGSSWGDNAGGEQHGEQA